MTPQGWEEKTLGDVCEINYGTRVVKNRDAGTVYPVYGGGGATFCMDTYNRENCMVIARFAMSEKCTRFVEGKFFLNDSGLTVKSKTSQLNQNFLDWQLISLNDKIYSLGRGSAQKNLNMDLFKKLQIKYPLSNKNQERIVAKLDEAFEAIDKVKANAEQNLTNAKELFEKELSKVYNDCKEWSITTFDKAKVYIQRGKSPKYAEHSVLPVINQKCIRWDNLQKEHLKYVDASQFDKWETVRYVKKGDILWNSTGTGTIGRAYLVNGTECEKAVVDSHVTIVRLNQEIINPKFAFYYIMSPIIQSKIDSLYTGSTNQVELSTSTIKDLNIQYPTLLEQQKIVEKLDVLQEQTKQLEAIYTKKIKECDELKQSILQKAFRGEL